jgi:hypothetical protein
LLLLLALASTFTAPVQAQTATTTTVAIGGISNGILQAGDGNFYSASSIDIDVACHDDPAYLCDYIYKMTPQGVASVFYSFERVPTQPSLDTFSITKDGLAPKSLFVGADGNLYGACPEHGPGGGGSIFRIALNDGTLTVLKSFKASLTSTVLEPGTFPLAVI